MISKLISDFIKYRIFIICITICILIGILGGIATTSSVKTWYPAVIKPSFTPPNWLFGPVWTLLYIIMGCAWALVLSNKNKLRNKANLFFILQLSFNCAWSFIYFGLHKIGIAWLDINLLCITLFITIYYFYKISKLAGYLLLPYILWVSFANILNGTIWWLNR